MASCGTRPEIDTKSHTHPHLKRVIQNQPPVVVKRTPNWQNALDNVHNLGEGVRFFGGKAGRDGGEGMGDGARVAASVLPGGIFRR